MSSGISNLCSTLSGQGHNQDLVGYVRTMRVVVNGNTATVLSWLPFEETQSFSYTPPLALQPGWNEIQAYIHWSDDYYDNGHWSTVALQLSSSGGPCIP